jgi:hypothetical protein
MCPWLDWQPPGIQFCEALVCGWVRQPINAWSNISFMIVGIYIWMQLKRGWSPLHLFSIAAFLVGVTSFLFHASMTFFFQFFDVSSMNMLILTCTCCNLARLKWIRPNQTTIAYIILLSLSMVITWFGKGKTGEWIFTFWIVSTFLSEFVLKARGEKPNFNPFFMASGCFILAFTIWTGDIRGWWCDPDNHYFQGHAVWHVLNAVAILYLYKFFKQFHPEALKAK